MHLPEGKISTVIYIMEQGLFSDQNRRPRRLILRVFQPMKILKNGNGNKVHN